MGRKYKRKQHANTLLICICAIAVTAMALFGMFVLSDRGEAAVTTPAVTDTEPPVTVNVLPPVTTVVPETTALPETTAVPETTVTYETIVPEEDGVRRIENFLVYPKDTPLL